MPTIGGQYWAWPPIRTRQFIFEGHTPIEGLPFTVIPDVAMRRICGNFVRGVNEQGCWRYGSRSGRPNIHFTSGGASHSISGNRLALLLLQDAPIPVGKTANHRCQNGNLCCSPLHVYAGTPTENMMDAYLDGRRAQAARTDFNWSDYPRLIRERAARSGQVIRATRFFCEDVQEELCHGRPEMQDLRPREAA